MDSSYHRPSTGFGAGVAWGSPILSLYRNGISSFPVGNVGIGTRAPAAKLTVVSADNTTNAYFTVLPQNLTQW